MASGATESGIRTSHLESLTSLRFVAAMMVIGIHVADGLDPFAGSREVFGLGYLALTFFFVLSGFVLTYNHRPDDHARTFYGRRVARVWPLHLVTTALAAVLLLASGDGLDLVALLLVLPLLQAFVPDSGIYYSYNDVSWSMSCEVFFYLLFPLVVVLAKRHVRRPTRWLLATGVGLCAVTAAVHLLAPALAGATGLSPVGVVGYTLEIFPGYRLGEFLLGVLLGVAFSRGTRSVVRVGPALWIAGACVVLLTLGDAVAPWPHGVANLLALPALLLLVAAAATDDLAGRTTWLHHPWAVRLGHGTYALYLLHFLVLTEVRERLGPAVPAWAAALLVVVVSVPAADLLHRYVERPADLRLRRAFDGRPAAPPPTGSRIPGKQCLGHLPFRG